MFQNIKADFKRIVEKRDHDDVTLIEAFKAAGFRKIARFILSLEFRAVFLYRSAKWCRQHHLSIFAFFLERYIEIIAGIAIDSNTDIGPGFKISHFGAVTISAVKIGLHAQISKCVTIGQGPDGKVPIIGNNVLIEAGAVIFGGITIGDNTIIGANAVVTKSIPENCIVLGNPGRIVKRDIPYQPN